MANYRQGRINEEMMRELGQIFPNVKDPRVSSSFVSVTGVQCTQDLKFAKIFFSVIGGADSGKEVKKGLESAAGYIRSQLAQRLNLRITPELKFYLDTASEHGAHILQLLKSVESDLIDDESEPSENVSRETDLSAERTGDESGND